MRAGRDFDAHNAKGSLAVVIVNDTFVRNFLSDRNAIGSAVNLTLGAREESSMGTKTVVGVVSDAIYMSLCPCAKRRHRRCTWRWRSGIFRSPECVYQHQHPLSD